MSKKHEKLKQLQKLVVEMRDIISADLNADKKASTIIKTKSTIIQTLNERIASTKHKMTDWKNKHDALKDELASQSVDVLDEDIDVWSEDVEQWVETLDDMREQYEETIHSLMPVVIEKTWVKNINKRGKFVTQNMFIVC